MGSINIQIFLVDFSVIPPTLYLPIDVTDSFFFSDINSPKQTVAGKITVIQVIIASIC